MTTLLTFLLLCTGLTFLSMLLKKKYTRVFDISILLAGVVVVLYRYHANYWTHISLIFIGVLVVLWIILTGTVACMKKVVVKNIKKTTSDRFNNKKEC